MEATLLIQVRLLDDRYHGTDDWPPSPARLFQALVAGNAVGAQVAEEDAVALRWLESTPGAPEIRAQRGRRGLPHTAYVPNNDLDAKGGDPRQVEKIRVAKRIQPRHLDASLPIAYVWRFEATDANLYRANRLLHMADRLYQLGRGVDMAWAKGQVLDQDEAETALAACPGDIFRPGSASGALSLDCPQPGSLDSLLLRFSAQRNRFSAVKDGRKIQVRFTNPPKARFRKLEYNPSERWRLFDLRADSPDAPFRAWPQSHAAALVEPVRDAMAARLADALPEQTAPIERLIVGRGAQSADKSRRIRLVPIPSIGHTQSNRAIRRILLQVPGDCPLPLADLQWAISGLRLGVQHDPACVVVPSDDPSLLRHYAIESGETARLWQTVTPVVLPHTAARRRIEPDHRRNPVQAKGGQERSLEEAQAASAVLQALRHEGIADRALSVRVQREPFSRKGLRAEAFADGSRFAKERLWHLELRFAEPREGPLIIGDGRYLGLGLLAPTEDPAGICCFNITQGLQQQAVRIDPEALARDLRRATMARVQRSIGSNRAMHAFFTGHEPDGAPLRDGSHRHLSFLSDMERQRILIVAPHILEGRSPSAFERKSLAILDQALTGFDQLRAGRAGRLHLEPTWLDLREDPLFRASTIWETVTDYRPTRHAKRTAPNEALTQDLAAELHRHDLPRPEIEVREAKAGPRGGLRGRVRLRFARPLAGPLVLGRTRHLGGGLFKAASDTP